MIVVIDSQIQNIVSIFCFHEFSGRDENPPPKRKKIEIPPEYVRIKASKAEV